MSIESVDDNLRLAIFERDFDRVKELVENGAELNYVCRNGYSPLMQAAEMEEIEIAKHLLEWGAFINFPGHNGNSALHIAVDISIDGTIQNGGSPGDEPLEMIRLFLRNGADKDLKNTHGETPIDWSKSHGSKKVLNLLSDKNS